MSKTLSALLEGYFDSIFIGDISSIYATIPYTIRLPSTVGTAGQVLTTNGAGLTSWSTVAGTGTVTSVGITPPAFLTASSAITGAGNITLAYNTTPLPVANGGTGLTTAVGEGKILTISSGAPAWVTPAFPGAGTVTSVGLSVTTTTGTPFLTVGSSPITGSGAITITTSSTGSGAVVLANSPTITGTLTASDIVTGVVGATTVNTGNINVVTMNAQNITSYNAIPTTSGGTGIATIGVANQVLTSNGSSLTWTTPAVLPGGILSVANGGTGVTTSTGTGSTVRSTAPYLSSVIADNIDIRLISPSLRITELAAGFASTIGLASYNGSWITASKAGDLVIKPTSSKATIITGTVDDDSPDYVIFCDPTDSASIQIVKPSPRLKLQRRPIGGPMGASAQLAIADGANDVFPNTATNELCIQASSSIRLRSNGSQIYMQNPVNFYNDQYSYKLKVTCESTAGATFSGTSIGDAVLKSDRSMYIGSPGNQFQIWGEGVYFNGTRTNIGNAVNGVSRYVTINSGLNDWATVSSNIVTFYGVSKDAGSWIVGQPMRARLYPQDGGDYYLVDTTITTSTANSPSPGLTKITFSTYLATPNGNYICKAVPSQVNGESGYVADPFGSVITYTARVAPGTWNVGTLISGIIDNYAVTGNVGANFLCNILAISEYPAGMYTITFPCEYDGTPFRVPRGDYHVAILPFTSALTWYALSSVDFDLFEEDLSFKRGLGLTYSLGNYGRFVNGYSFPVIVQVQYEAAKSIFTLPLVPPIPYAGDTFNQYAGYVNSALTVINGQTSIWIEANVDGISLGPVTVPSTAVASGAATIVLDPGEYIQLRGFNYAPINGGIWDGTRLTITVTRLQ